VLVTAIELCCRAENEFQKCILVILLVFVCLVSMGA
jgi:hypothetical protein